MKLDEIEEYIKNFLNNKSDQSISHGWDHVNRVRKKSLEIASHYSDVNRGTGHIRAKTYVSVLHA